MSVLADQKTAQLIQYKFTLQIIVKPLVKVVFDAEPKYDDHFFRYSFFWVNKIFFSNFFSFYAESEYDSDFFNIYFLVSANLFLTKNIFCQLFPKTSLNVTFYTQYRYEVYLAIEYQLICCLFNSWKYESFSDPLNIQFIIHTSIKSHFDRRWKL